MATETTVAPDPTILSTPEPAAPKEPETKLFTPEPTKPADTPADAAPAAPTDGKPPVADAAKPDAPQEPPKDDKPPTEAKAPGAPTAPATPPTDYDLKLPEGSHLSAADLDVIKAEAKATGLTKEQAEGVLKSRDEGMKQARTLWKEQCTTDPEYGGTQLPQNMELAKRAWDKLASPALKQMAEQTGFGNHPEVVRLMVRIGKMFSEDQIVRGTVGNAPAKKSNEEILYGKTTPSSSQEPMA